MPRIATRTAMLTARIEPSLKQDAEKILRDLGLSTTQAILLFFSQIKLRKGMPFEVTIPTAQENKQNKTKGSK